MEKYLETFPQSKFFLSIGGESTTQEMCFIWLHTYPRLSFNVCLGRRGGVEETTPTPSPSTNGTEMVWTKEAASICGDGTRMEEVGLADLKEGN